MFNSIKHWYQGEGKVTKGHVGENCILIPTPYMEYHWTAQFVRYIVKFYLEHWKWLWGTVVALLAIYVVYLGFTKSQ